MATYQAESVDIDDLKTLFENNWDIKSGGEIPQPEFVVSDRARFDPSLQWASTPRFAFVNLSLGPVTEEQDGYAYAHVKQRAIATIDFWTKRTSTVAGGTNRQYLHDIKQELRRIIYANKHSLANWQIMEYQDFEEIYRDSNTIGGHGTIRLQLRNAGVVAPGELVDEDLFTRSDAAIGGEWTQDNGTWEVVSNKAALQSATANAICRFTPVTFKKNHRVQVDIITAAAMDSGLVFRHSGSTSYWLIRLITTGGVNYLRLIDQSSGETQVAEVRAPGGGWTDGDAIEIAVDLYNDCFSVSFNGLAMIQLESSSHGSSITYGLYSNSDQNTRFDNFHIFESGGSGR